MKVTALKTFVGKAGLIKAGTRFETDDLHVKQLERNGLVSRHEVKPMEPEIKAPSGDDEALLAELRACATNLEIPNANRMQEATLRKRIAEAEKLAGEDDGDGDGEDDEPDPGTEGEDGSDADADGGQDAAPEQPEQPEQGDGEQGSNEDEAAKS